MKKLLLLSILTTLSFATYYEIGGGIKVKEFTPKSDDSKVCIAVKLFGDSVSIHCFDKKIEKDYQK